MLEIRIVDQEDYELLVKIISDLESYFVLVNDSGQTKLKEFGDNAH